MLYLLGELVCQYQCLCAAAAEAEAEAAAAAVYTRPASATVRKWGNIK